MLLKLCDKIIVNRKVEELNMKLLATDYDGTLRYAQDVMPEDLKSIEEWKNKGNKFVIVTGRSKESIDAQIKLFNLFQR